MFLCDPPVFNNKRVMGQRKYYAPLPTLPSKTDITRFDGTVPAVSLLAVDYFLVYFSDFLLWMVLTLSVKPHGDVVGPIDVSTGTGIIVINLLNLFMRLLSQTCLIKRKQ